ncbi:MAG: pyridoxal-phosphate dependent enzyme, partial [Gemmobacter sp.]
MFTTEELQAATALVHRHMAPTPLYAWPQLARRLGATVWVKHENHGPTGAFKVRGGITFIDWLRRTHPDCPGIVTATRGNHGQSQARAARAAGLRAVVYAPRGNSTEKNAAMRAFGAELHEVGDDFDAAREAAMAAGAAEGLFAVPPFHRELVRGVATYAWEMFTAKPDLHPVYVPIGCGSGICGVIAAVGLTLLTQAYRIADSNAVAPFEYSYMLWGVLWGWLFFAEWPDAMGWLGIVVIMAAGIGLAGTAAIGQELPFTEEGWSRGIQYTMPGYQATGAFGWGMALADLDGDDDLDLVLLGRSNGLPGIFENDGTGHFLNRSFGSGMFPLADGSGVIAFDFDGDRDLDLLFTQAPGSTRLHRN